jgi:hypothetical protein
MSARDSGGQDEGGGAFREDVERVRAVRQTVGADVDVLIDANNKWNACEAIRFGRAVEKYDLFWLEEPVEPDDFRVRGGKDALTFRWWLRERVHAVGARELIGPPR